MHINEQLGAVKEPCPKCNGTGWLEPIGPCSDGSYVTSRRCLHCDGEGFQWEWPEDFADPEDALWR